MWIFKFIGAHVLEFEKESCYMKTRCPICHDSVGSYKTDFEDVGDNKIRYQFTPQNYCSNCGTKLNWKKIDLTNEWFDR